ncbi:MAG TPA: TetR/AcrR family transcriptional regulator [Actinocrinis sp.]|uniref:TetR/AcrR family transcriptional regulator n=1 Tax=Actinocrinis sp. TaxID=1920516 RepID=UPI002D308616|nr:TetR/AcrR family transcriptional regulator [Actinocrinis sp.]HZU55917.1 TetR/AcrR family transcriptional regulator [Actinocrinis sp.]
MAETDRARPHGESTRADALKNREHILRVARDAFAEDGAVSLNTIAKRAGVGPGTLYRHFPTREALILAVYQQEVFRVADEVPKLLAEHPPLQAFRRWFHTLAAYVRIKHGLGDALHTAAAQAVVNQVYAPIVGAVGQLLRACADDGSLRPDLDPDDVLMLMSFLWRVGTDAAGTAQAERLMEMAITGLRP